ncbi:MAG TPA: phosphoribosyltransferase, partial [Terriglobales bacterium]|nr:phosphoribosyltransferase [Terriglobales bacterium]
THAGRELAAKLKHYANQPGVLVLALPRGGVVVGFEVARALNAQLDVFLVRKLGVPGQWELALGAIASGGIRVLNEEVLQVLPVSEEVIENIAAAEQRELERREQAYRGGRPAPEVRGRTVILVDDGIATGSTMLAAVRALRQQQPERIVVATPVAPASACEELAQEADEVVCLACPEPFYAISQWYEDFAQTSDDEVRELLERASSTRGSGGRPTQAA